MGTLASSAGILLAVAIVVVKGVTPALYVTNPANAQIVVAAILLTTSLVPLTWRLKENSVKGVSVILVLILILANMRILQLNTRSFNQLSQKILGDYMDHKNIQVMCLSEVWNHNYKMGS